MSNEKKQTGIDPAALAAVALAAAISVVAPPGPYGPSSMFIGVAILLLVFAYDVNPRRSNFQSWAFAAIVSLIIMLALGYPLECIFSQHHAERIGILLREKKETQDYSDVPPVWVIGLWLGFTCLVYLIDRRKRHGGNGQPVAKSKPPHHK